MKYKLTRKLFIYFSIILMVFSLVVGVSFLFLFNNYTRDSAIRDLQEEALRVSTSLSQYMIESEDTQPTGKNSMNKQGSSTNRFGNYIYLLNEALVHDIWVVDKDAQTIRVGSQKHTITYKELPESAKQLVGDVFSGNTVTSDSFSPLLDTATLSVGTPIYDSDGNVFAALILHANHTDVQVASRKGLQILAISFCIALLLGVFISIWLANRFIQPLKKMERTTKKIAEGDYTSYTNVQQDDELGQLANRIDMVSKRLYEAELELKKQDQARKDFLSIISHELRTPVSVIRGSIEGLLDGIPSTTNQRLGYYQQIQSETIHLERMIHDLLDLSRLQNPKYAIIKEQVCVTQILTDAVRSIQGVAKQKNITLDYDAQNLSCLMQGDYSRLRQMFLIVFDNAIKFSNENETIHVQAIEKDLVCVITITDTGIGMNKNTLEHIFDSFYMDVERSNGSGLGLAIAKEIGDRHAITIQIDSEIDKGTSVQFTIPCTSKRNILP